MPDRRTGAHMRSKAAVGWGAALSILGLLCLVAAAILVWVIVPDRKQLPADTNVTRQFEGTANVMLNPAALATGDFRNALLTNVPVTAERTVQVTATEGNAAQVADVRSLAAGGVQVGRTQASYAVDRTTLEATEPASGWTVTPHQGLTVSWPIGAERRDYIAWVNETQTTTTARYQREEERGGVNTYVYEVTAPAAPIRDQQVLATLPPAIPGTVLAGLADVLPIPDSAKAQLAQVLPNLGDPIPLRYTYESTSTFWVEPTTGLVVDTERSEIRRAGIGEAGGAPLAIPVFDVTTSFTDEAVNEAASDASGAKTRLDLFGTVLPWILGILGLALLVAGLILLALGMRRRRTVDGPRDRPGPLPGQVPP